MLAFLAAEGVVMLFGRGDEERSLAAALAGLVLVAWMAAWTFPALSDVRDHDTPPHAATMWVREHLDPRATHLVVHGSMGPYAEVYLREYRRDLLEEDPATARLPAKNDYFLIEGTSNAPHAANFEWAKSRLWNLARQRYFVASVSPLEEDVSFREGWYGPEPGGEGALRWMGRRSTTLLQPFRRLDAVISLRFHVPVDALASPPTIRLSMNGSVIDTFTAIRPDYERKYRVHPRSEGQNDLVIETSEAVNLRTLGRGDDARDLGLRLDGIAWVPGRE
jgi:hypothetical protein